jgi:hypothetical protein
MEQAEQPLKIPKYSQKRFGTSENPDPESRQRIKWWMATCLISVALLIDAIQALLTFMVIGAVLSPIISVGAAFLFWLWYQILGVSYIKNPKRLTTFGVQSLIEIIPAIDIFPALTLGNIITVLITRSEDKGGIISKVASVGRARATNINSAKKAA